MGTAIDAGVRSWGSYGYMFRTEVILWGMFLEHHPRQSQHGDRLAGVPRLAQAFWEVPSRRAFSAARRSGLSITCSVTPSRRARRPTRDRRSSASACARASVSLATNAISTLSTVRPRLISRHEITNGARWSSSALAKTRVRRRTSVQSRYDPGTPSKARNSSTVPDQTGWRRR